MFDFQSQRRARKEQIVAVRREFFNDLLTEWSNPPEDIDVLMGQSDYLILPDEGRTAVAINDPDRGMLVQSFTPPEAWGKRMRFIYSVWLAGDWIRYGILIQADPKLLAVFSSHNESTESLERVWDRPASLISREGGLLMEWRFEDPSFYDDYLLSDRYLKIARHLHFQMGHSIHEASAERSSFSTDP